MRVPDFFIVGAPKSGTTSMWHYLSQHPNVYMGEVKETHFLSPEFAPAAWSDRSRYLQNYAGAESHQRIGEASVFYLYSRTAASNILEMNHDARVIIMLREPVAMLHALHGEFRLASNEEDLPTFEQALAAEEERKQGLRLPRNLAIPPEWLLYREVGRYSSQVERFLKLYGQDHVLILWFDEFQRDSAGAYDRTCRFLGLDPSFIPEFEVHNRAKQYRSTLLGHAMRAYSRSPVGLVRMLLPDPAFRRRISDLLWRWNVRSGRRDRLRADVEAALRSELSPDVEALSRLTGQDLNHWLARTPKAAVASG